MDAWGSAVAPPTAHAALMRAAEVRFACLDGQFGTRLTVGAWRLGT
jgi:hypothetical protein